MIMSTRKTAWRTKGKALSQMLMSMVMLLLIPMQKDNANQGTCLEDQGRRPFADANADVNANTNANANQPASEISISIREPTCQLIVMMMTLINIQNYLAKNI